MARRKKKKNRAKAKSKKNQIPLPILQKRVKRLIAIVNARSRNQ